MQTCAITKPHITLLINRRIGPDCDSVFSHAMGNDGSFGRKLECVRGWGGQQ